MKKYLFVVTIALFTIALSCTKNTTVKTEMPLQTLVNNKFLDSIQPAYDGVTEEVGYRFFSTKKGRITKLGAYMPAKGSYRVILWDNLTETVIDSAIVQITNPNQFSYTAINPVNVETNKKYVISVYCNTTTTYYYFSQRKQPNKLDLPIVSGTVIIMDPVLNLRCNGLCFPNTITRRDAISGIPDIVFEPTE